MVCHVWHIPIESLTRIARLCRQAVTYTKSNTNSARLKWILTPAYQQHNARTSLLSFYHNMDSQASPRMDLLPLLAILRCIILNFMISKEVFITIQEIQVTKQVLAAFSTALTLTCARV